VIDLHCHLLPGVDDGSRSVEQSVKVLKELARAGLTDVCLTPHLRAMQAAAGPPDAHQQAYEALRAAAPAAPRLHRGAEVMLDRPLEGGGERLRRVTLGGTRYLLVEFPRLVPAETVTNALHRVVGLRLVPVLAHPERYSACSPATVGRWRETGALMQVDATTLLSPQARGQRARALLTHGLADLLAGDNHGDDRSIVTGFRFVEAQDAPEQAELLTVSNPAAILRDEPTTAVPPVRIRRSLLQRLRQMLEGEQ
jgi:protein-tyrosine phosphatase